MSSSLLLQQCSACLVRLTLIVFVMGGRWPYSWCLVGCCLQNLFKIAHSILVKLLSSFFSSRLLIIQVVHPYSSINTTTAWKKLRFILSIRSDFHMTDSLSIAVHAFVSRVSWSFSVDETLLPRYVNLSTQNVLRVFLCVKISLSFTINQLSRIDHFQLIIIKWRYWDFHNYLCIIHTRVYSHP